LRGTLLATHNEGGIIQNFGRSVTLPLTSVLLILTAKFSVQEILFLEVALTESWVIFITRLSQGNGEENMLPSWQLLAAVVGVDILASIFAIFGWISGPAPKSGWTNIVTVVRVWGFSFGVTIIIALICASSFPRFSGVLTSRDRLAPE
jgi:H+-transporting ATPase